MLTILSPAKKLLKFEQPFDGAYTERQFDTHTRTLIKILKEKSQSDIAGLMHLSKDLAALNFERYQAYDLHSDPIHTSYPAVYFFQGDVYQSLEANQWSPNAIEYAQSHLAILSGLYGLLRPLDLMQPYRLEMGTRLANEKGANLYDFWRETLTQKINDLLASHSTPCLVNLASSEYASAIDFAKLNHPYVNIVFKEEKQGQQKIVGIHAKKARGAMARFLMTEQVDTIDGIKSFDKRGYAFDASQSDNTSMVFVCNRD